MKKGHLKLHTNSKNIHFVYSYFQGIPEKNPSQRHIYSTSDKQDKKDAGPPICISCDLQLQYNCTFNNAIFSPK